MPEATKFYLQLFILFLGQALELLPNARDRQHLVGARLVGLSGRTSQRVDDAVLQVRAHFVEACRCARARPSRTRGRMGSCLFLKWKFL